MYKLLAIGGTFDRLHAGHKTFILSAFGKSEKVIIGLTSDEYTRRKFQNPNSKFQIQIYSFNDRKKELEQFIQDEGLSKRAEIVKINDVYGGADKNDKLEAIAVTKDSLGGAQLINKRRKENGLKTLIIVITDLVKAHDLDTIASTRIRNGEIDRSGRLYTKIPLWGKKIPEELRLKLKEPLGEFIAGDENDHHEVVSQLKKLIRKAHPVMIITIGDEVTKLCNELKLPVNLSIFDFMVKRVRKYYSVEELGFTLNDGSCRESVPKVASERSRKDTSFPSSPSRSLNRSSYWDPSFASPVFKIIINPPGHISVELVHSIQKAIGLYYKDGLKSIIQIDGEDDLAALPAILFAPLGAIVVYGQPHQGIVVVGVTEVLKEKLVRLIGNFGKH